VREIKLRRRVKKRKHFISKRGIRFEYIEQRINQREEEVGIPARIMLLDENDVIIDEKEVKVKKWTEGDTAIIQWAVTIS